MNITEKIAATHLGKKSVGSEFYDKTLLVAVPRSENRHQYGIEENNLPFVGFDVWNAYEVSFVSKHGVPYNYVLKIKYPATSPYIVESKSLKLYLNSFNMTPLAETEQESVDYFLKTVKTDLDELLQTNVELCLHRRINKDSSTMFESFTDIKELIDVDEIECNHYKEAPELLTYDQRNDGKCVRVNIDTLRSNCRVTHQPDFGDLFVYIKSTPGIDYASLFEYVTSFRKEFHFHEECVEMIYKRLLDKYQPEDLMVGALYTRRGGIDICPIRANKPELLDKELADITCYAKRTAKQ